MTVPLAQIFSARPGVPNYPNSPRRIQLLRIEPRSSIMQARSADEAGVELGMSAGVGETVGDGTDSD